jgi:lysozyme family protein
MPEINANVSLRDGPNGSKIGGKIAHAGDGVTVIETKDGWSHVKINNAGQDEGWVQSTFIDQAGAGSTAPPIDKQQFANSCVIQALIDGVNPHYLVGVAQLRSGIAAGNDGDRLGPFRLTAQEWKEVVPPFTENDINSNNQQIGGFSLMVRKRMAALGAGVTPVQLYKAQWADAPDDIGDKLKAAFDATADIEAKAEADTLDPQVVVIGKAGKSLQNLKAANQERWQKMNVHSDRLSKIDKVADRLIAPDRKARYQGITAKTNVPWFVIAVIHEREAGEDRNFLANIAQGNPWNKVSVDVPKGRGPFASFEDAAFDALMNCAPHAGRWGDWTSGGALTLLEQYNGLGYALRGLPSPYIWASSDQYIKGKFTSDHHFDPEHVDDQLGCAPLLRRMQEKDASIKFSEDAG